MDEHLLAFDLGTTGNKATLLHAATGRVASHAFSPYSTHYTEDGGAEQSPADWWHSAVDCCRQLKSRAPDAFSSVAAIGASGAMNGLVAVDREGVAVRPAIIHADIRSTNQCRTLAHAVGEQAYFNATSNRLDPHLTLPKAMWLAQNEPLSLASAAYFVQSKDYLVARLTGNVGLTDPSDASLTGGFSVRRRQWLPDLWAEAGVPADKLPRVIPSSQIAGKLTDQAAREIGLPAGVPVVMGGGDGACASAGSGVGSSANGPEAYNYLGGTSWIGLVLSEPLADNRLSCFCCLDERVTAFGTVQAAGSSVEWLGEILGRSNGFSELDRAAQLAGPGAHNLFFLPYLQGERAPLWDSDARGVFFGLSSSHTRGDLFRAVIEGVGFALRSILDVFSENGYPIPAIRLLGGGANSALWQSVLAAIFNRPLHVLADASSATSVGAAMAAGVGVGLYPSIAQAARIVSVQKKQAAGKGLARTYVPRYAFYQSLYPILAERFAALSQLNKFDPITQVPPISSSGQASGKGGEVGASGPPLPLRERGRG